MKPTHQQSSFTEKVLSSVSRIPRGTTKSYQDIAYEAGSPRAVRVVGTVLAHNTDTSVPCHRVIRKDGSLGNYNGLLGKTKEELLREEGAL
jgi:O-6-methylguanine DNA methyltransferase